jgi:hypothetical protein
VICLHSPNVPGALARALNIMSGESVFIEYLYAYSMDDNSANIVLKPDNIEKCIEVLQAHQMELVSANEMYKI